MSLPKHLKKEGIYTVIDLLARLKKEGFGYTRISLRKYERLGIIPQPRRMKIGQFETRVYSKEEINDVVKKLKAAPGKKFVEG